MVKDPSQPAKAHMRFWTLSSDDTGIIWLHVAVQVAAYDLAGAA